MTQIIEMIDAAMVEMASITPPLRRSECEQLIRAALSAMEKQEPVAYVMEFNDGTTTIQKTAYWDCKSVTPLYTAPKVIPLTDEEIDAILVVWPRNLGPKAYARAIEKAHNIGGQQS